MLRALQALPVVLAVLVLAGSTAPPTLPGNLRQGRVDFRGGWEEGGWKPWSHIEWKGALSGSPGLSREFELVHLPRRTGRYAARFAVSPGDEYGASSGERSLAVWLTSDEREGDTYYYAWSTLFPFDWVTPHGWAITTEWHADRRFELAPLRFDVVGSDRLRLDMTTGTCTGPATCSYEHNHVVLDTLAKGHWNDFVLRVHWSTTDGSVELWHRLEGAQSFRLVLRLPHVPTLPAMQGDPTPATIYVEQGIYRGDGTPGTTVVYHDSFRRATTWAAAASVWPRDGT